MSYQRNLTYGQYRELLKNPNVQRLLRSIRFAEGSDPTGTRGYDAYRVMFGGSLAPDLTRHPDRVIHTGRHSSAAAGAYQFMPGTWQRVMNKLGRENFPVGNEFNPEAQDIAALYLARERLLPIGGLAAVDRAGITEEISNLLSPEWAAFPKLGGGSYYSNQQSQKLSDIQRSFGGVAPTGPPPSPAPAGATPEQVEAANRAIKEYYENAARYAEQDPLVPLDVYRSIGKPEDLTPVQKGNQFADDVMKTIKANIIGSILTGQTNNMVNSAIQEGLGVGFTNSLARGISL